MRSKLISALSVIGAVTVLVLAANTVALAATGSSLIAGKTTTAGKATTIKRTTSGTAFKVKTKSSANSPFAVNGRGRVGNLNADLVDGFDSASLRNRTYEFTSSDFTGKSSVRYVLPLPAGSYLVSYSNFFDNLNSTGGIQCYIRQENSTGSDITVGYSAFIYTADPDWRPAMTGTGVVTKGAKSTVEVSCQADGNHTFNEGDIRITATETQKVSTKVLNPDDSILLRQKAH